MTSSGWLCQTDVSIVAFSDIPIGRFMHPALTTVQLPLETMGRRAVEMLIELINGQEVADAMVDDPPQLTIRASTGPPAERMSLVP